MANLFNKLMIRQMQEQVNNFLELSKKPIPKNGWIRTIRQALGISSRILAKRLNCSQANITMMESRERKGTINLNTLDQLAKAMNCKLVYCIVPIQPFDKMLEEQAILIAKRQITLVHHSMLLEEQGLSEQQLKQMEEDYIRELLQGNPKKLWRTDEF